MRRIQRRKADALPASRPTYKELYQAWEQNITDQVAARELARSSADTYRTGVKWFLSWLRGRPAAPDIVRSWKAYLAKRGLTPNSVNTLLLGVKNFVEWGVQNKAVDPVILERIKLVPRDYHRNVHLREPLSNDEARSVLQALDHDSDLGKRDAAIFGMMLYSGCRQSDIVNADLPNLVREEERYVLKIRGKGRLEADEKIFVTHPDAVKWLDDYVPIREAKNTRDRLPLFINFGRFAKYERISSRDVRHIVKSYFRRAGVDESKSAHSMRHSAALSALDHGAPLDKIQAMLRHTSIETTMIYVRSRERERHPAEEYISYDEQPTEPQPS